MIEAKNITKTYNKGTRKANQVLLNASLTLPDKGLVCIVGKSGIGKSTILNAIGGLISYEGTILYDKQQVNVEKYRRKNIGYVFQDFLLFDELSVRDNIKIALNLNGIYDEEEISSRVSLLLKAVDLDINSNRRASALSLGQRQRVAIARALASNPHLILADEPTGNLDSKNSLVVMDILKRLSLDRLVIVVTHNANLVNLYADQAFAIIDKNFQEINPKDQQLEEAYSKQKELEVGEMTRKDYEDDNFILRLYSSSDKNSVKSEIQIVRKDGKILIIGDNISLASPKEVTLAESKTEKTEEQDKEEKKESQQAVNLNFPPRQDKKTFKDTSLYSVLNQRFSAKRLGFGKAMLRVIEIILPLVAFILVDVIFGTLSEAGKYNVSVSNMDNLVALYQKVEYNPDGTESSDNTETQQTNMTREELAAIMNDYANSKLIDTPAFNFASGFNNTSSGFSYYTSKVAINLACFSIASEVKNNISLDSSNFNLTLVDKAKYQDIPACAGLKSYELADNEIVFDKSFVTYIKNNYNPSFFSGKSLEEMLVGCTIEVPYVTYDDAHLSSVCHHPIVYKVKGIEDTGFEIAYANSKTTDSFRRLFPSSQLPEVVSYLKSYEASNLPYPDLGGYKMVEYEDAIKDPDYTITQIDPSVSDDFAKEGNGYPLSFLSDSAKEKIYRDGRYNTYSTGLYYSLILNYSLNYKVVYNPDPTAKVIVFRDYTQGTASVDSSSAFISGVIVNSIVMKRSHLNDYSSLKLTSGSELPSKNNEVLLPSCFQPFLGDVGNLAKMITFSGYYESDDFSSPVYISDALDIEFSYPKFLNTVYYSTGSGLNYALLNSGNFFVSSDSAATVKYFKDHPEYKVEAITYNTLFRDTVTKSVVDTLKPLIISVSVLAGLMVAILVMDNFSRINKMKYKYGVLRCLGEGKGQIILDDSTSLLVDTFFSCAVPTAILGILLGIFALFYMGAGYYFLFLLAVIAINFIASEIPLFILLAKKPNDIIRSLQ